MDNILPQNKILWIKRMAISSFCIFIFTLLINYYREPLFGIKEGYAPLNFSFNFLFFLPAMSISLILGLASLGRILKHWKTWSDLNKKLICMGFSTPVIILFFIRIILK